MYEFINPFLGNKMSTFEEYGAFNRGFLLMFLFQNPKQWHCNADDWHNTCDLFDRLGCFLFYDSKMTTVQQVNSARRF